MTTYKGYEFVQSFGPQMTALLVVAVVWTLFWKGIALWKAGRNGQPVWFVVLFLANSLGVLEIIYIVFFQKKRTTF